MAQKMEAIGQLTGGVAHDFNNLLHVTRVSAELARRALPAGSAALPEVERVLDSTRRAATLVKQLLAVSSHQAFEPRVLDLSKVVRDLVKILAHALGERVCIQVVPAQSPALVRGDLGQLEQVLMNLCVNARDAMPEGGQLVIRTEKLHLDEQWCAQRVGAEPGEYVLLSVKDSGEGMDEATMARVFEPFFTTKEVGKGTGLGLATVYGIVRQHGGWLSVISAPGEGAEFEIYLPLARGETEEEALSASPGSASGPLTVLLAEDDDQVRLISSLLLQEAGFEVLQAADGAEAMAVFDANEHDIDVALLDKIMPRGNGREVCRHIRLSRPELPIIFASGYSPEAGETGGCCPGLRRLDKPYGREELLGLLSEVLDRGD